MPIFYPLSKAALHSLTLLLLAVVCMRFLRLVLFLAFKPIIRYVTSTNRKKKPCRSLRKTLAVVACHRYTLNYTKFCCYDGLALFRCRRLVTLLSRCLGHSANVSRVYFFNLGTNKVPPNVKRHS